MQDDDIFDNDGRVKKSVHDSHHVFIHQEKSDKERKREMREKVKLAVIIMFLTGVFSSVFGVIWYAIKVFIANGGQA